MPLSQVGVHLIHLREAIAVRVETASVRGVLDPVRGLQGISRLTQVFSLDMD